MEIRIVTERFSISENDLSLAEYGLPIDVFDNPPVFQVRFVVRSPYYLISENGKFQFVRDYQERFNKVKHQIYENDYLTIDRSFNEPSDRFESLRQLNLIVKDVKHTIQTKFVVKNKIELANIDLVGTWPVYDSLNQSSLERELHRQTVADVKEFSDGDDKTDFD